MRLLPYIVRQARRCADTGMPLMQAMPVAFPDSREGRAFPYQYLFGDELLVCPAPLDRPPLFSRGTSLAPFGGGLD